MKPIQALPAALALLSIIGCTPSRSETYLWSDSPKAENNGCEVAVTGYWEHADHIHVRMEIRDLTQRDLTFKSGHWIVVHAAGETVNGKVTVQKIDSDPDAREIFEDIPVPGDFTVHGHSSETIDADFPMAKKLASVNVPWTLDLAGQWTFGAAMNIEIPVGSGTATSALPASPEPTPGHG
jgi:hypothetical protein